jgi:hypothetical protein
MKSNINKSRLWTTVLLSVLAIIFVSCSDDDSIVSEDLWNISGNQIVSIKPERTKNLRNPMTGWVLYAGLGDGMTYDFWNKYDNFNSSVGKVKVSDYATTLYVRGAWSDFNPEKGVYVWQKNCNTEAAKKFRMLEDGAKERGLKLAFTFVVDSRDKHYNFTPDFVRDAGAKGFISTTGSVQVWSPYPDDPIFQQYYAAFLKDFAAEYDDPDKTMFVSGFGLGKWGETHSLIYSTGDETPKQAVFDWITNLMSGLFKSVPIVINYHRCLLSLNSFSNASTSEAEEMLRKAVDRGFSLRHDAFGMKSYYTTWERNFAASMRYVRPIIMEGGWVESSHGSSINGDGYANYAEVRQGEFDEGKGACVNMMDLRYNSNFDAGETHSWFNSAYKLVEQFIAEGGYRLWPDKISVPTIASSNGEVSITHRWSNLGWGYCPTNIPQWNQKYKVAFALLDNSTLKPQYVFVDETPELSDWILNKPKTYNVKFGLNGVKAGDYTWAVGLVDSTKNNAIGIKIAAKDDQLTSEGWLKLAGISVK